MVHPSRMCILHRKFNFFSREWGALGGSGSVLSSANEMAEWLHVQLNYGTSQTGTRVFPEEVIKETHDPVNGYPSSSSYWLRPNIPITLDDSKYALGWRTGFYRGKDNLLSRGKTLSLIEVDHAIYLDQSWSTLINSLLF